MPRLCIDAELLALAPAVWLQVSRQTGMPDNWQSEACVQKTMKTHRKINIFRLDLSAEDAPARSLSLMYRFTSIKHTFFKIHLDIALRQ